MMPTTVGQMGGKIAVSLGVAAGILFLLIANAHLVYVSIATQPDCIDHLKRGVSAAAAGKFSAASSSCTPPQ
jgi:hypothetical protein